jgi:hypothetical protein
MRASLISKADSPYWSLSQIHRSFTLIIDDVDINRCIAQQKEYYLQNREHSISMTWLEREMTGENSLNSSTNAAKEDPGRN